ncbi:MAG: LacI family DNA-binding transcriptional regulator [Victivallaceae bacterium]
MVTQKTIAEKLGISPSLVSRALAGTAGNIGASEETVRKIRETARELGYTPNAAALVLRGAKSKTIGVVIKDFGDPFLGRMISALQKEAAASGCSLLLTGFDFAARQPRDAASLLRYRPDALFIGGSDICSGWIKPFLKANIPIAQIGSDADYPGVARVETDEEAGLRKLLDYVLAAGHRKLGFIGSDNGPHRRRRLILEKELRQRRIKLGDVAFSIVTDGENVGLRAMNELLARGKARRPTAVLAADDAVAQGALRSIHNAGLTVPGDVSLTGIDDIPAAELMIPALTTIRVPIGRMVEEAFRLVFHGGGEEKPPPRRLEPKLIERESCAAPAAERR